MLVTLTNEFHNRETRVRVIDGRVSHRAGLRAWRALCGVERCTCSGQLGQRSTQFHKGAPLEILPDFEAGGDRPGVRAAIVRRIGGEYKRMRAAKLRQLDKF